MITRFFTKAGLLALFIFCLASPGWAQSDDDYGPPLPEASKPAEVTPPKPSKE